VSTEWRYKWKEKEDINVKDDLSKSFCYYLCNQWIRWIIGHVVLNCIYYYCHAKIYKFLLCIQTYLILTSFFIIFIIKYILCYYICNFGFYWDLGFLFCIFIFLPSFFYFYFFFSFICCKFCLLSNFLIYLV
jgi:hypothetical protein